ncbi:hypothetical protein ACLOAV_003972 [Pseudogymnoascus australis]
MSASAMKLSTPSKAPSTPTAQTTPSTPQTGTWQHPRFAEIARRQNATTFSDRHVRSVVYNIGSLLFCWIGENFIQSNLQPYPQYIYNLLRLLFLANILIAILPLLRPKDTLADIPLTPAQRSLLGLPASSTPPTPGSTYITPPRYARSPAPRNSGSNSSSPLSGSPLSGRNSPINGTPGKEGRGSPYNPNASPLLHKTFNNQRRDSYGSPSPLGRVGSGEPGTPSPSGAGKASVGLNSRWLYEKGRRTSQGGSGGRLFNKLD